jgi:copper chaperone CopZ
MCRKWFLFRFRAVTTISRLIVLPVNSQNSSRYSKHLKVVDNAFFDTVCSGLFRLAYHVEADVTRRKTLQPCSLPPSLNGLDLPFKTPGSRAPLAFVVVDGENGGTAFHQGSVIFAAIIFATGRIDMRGLRALLFASLGALLVSVSVARAETKVELKGVHLCCGKCVAGVKSALHDLDGIKATCDQEKSIVTITASDDAAAQKALDALAAHGFHGDTGSSTLKMKEDSGVIAGKVTSLKLGGIHNCCGSCNSAIKKAIKKVDGVTGDTAKAKTDSLTVTGNFDGAELVKALNAAGFHVKVQQ